ncbi:MAG: hypothetical protein Q9182_005226 [Xanthomendoza sp. 2 TL-2023]
MGLFLQGDQPVQASLFDAHLVFDVKDFCFMSLHLLHGDLIARDSALLDTVSYGHRARFRDKLNLAIFGIIGPDFMILLSVGQWESARRSVQEFKPITPEGKKWTMKQAHFADMGGYHLEAPGSPAFPLNARQLFFLLSNHYIDFPEGDDTDIDDRNKRDGLARLLTAVQILVFLIKSIVRASRHLSITSLEVTTFAFIFAMLLASWFWKDKPQDVNKPVVLKSKASISEILTNTGIVLNEDYVYTPLDFLNDEEWFINMAWTRGRKFLRNVFFGLLWNDQQSRPVKKLRSDVVPSLSLPLMIICEHLVIIYSAIFMAGWNCEFPTPIERLLWRITITTMLVFGFLGGWLFFFIDILFVRKQQRNPASRPVLRTMGQSLLAWLVPKPVLSQVHDLGRTEEAAAGWEDRYFERIPQVPRPLLATAATMSVVYFWTRLFVLVEDFVGLRALPARERRKSFQTTAIAAATIPTEIHTILPSLRTTVPADLPEFELPVAAPLDPLRPPLPEDPEDEPCPLDEPLEELPDEPLLPLEEPDDPEEPEEPEEPDEPPELPPPPRWIRVGGMEIPRLARGFREGRVRAEMREMEARRRERRVVRRIVRVAGGG